MNTSKPKLMPVIIGFTGHRDIPPEYIAYLERRVEAQLLSIRRMYPNCPITVLSSLAEGADRLCARSALKTGCRLAAPLPMEQDEYEKDFDEISTHDFRELLSRCDEVFTVCPIEPKPAPDGDPARSYYYRQAGLYVAKRAHILIALWDGAEKLSPEGGGTYETICFARHENAIICHIPTPRLSSMDSGEPEIGESCVPAIPKDERLTAIEEFNRDIVRYETEINSSILQNKQYVIDAPCEKQLDANLAGVLNAFLCADALSIKYRDLKLLALKLLSGFGLLLVLTFLAYDEMESELMLYVYGVFIILMFAVYRITSKRGLHEKYISYRALAEALRVQFYWALGGVSQNVCDGYTYAQNLELGFVRFIINALGVTGAGNSDLKKRPTGTSLDCVYRFWIRGQHDYHKSSASKKDKQYRRNNIASKSLIVLSVLLFVFVVVMELFFKTKMGEALPVSDALRNFLLIHEGEDIIWRGIIKIVCGMVPAGTAFLANYYESLSLPNQILESRHMTALFGAAPQGGDSLTGVHLAMLGRESVIESGGWYISQKENAPGLFI